MQSKSQRYAKALKDVLSRASSAVQEKRIRKFRDLLKKRGDLKLATKILQEFQKAWKERKGKIAQVVSSKPLGRSTRLSLERALKRRGFLYEENIDPEVIGGISLFLGSEFLIDNTIRGKIQKLRNL